MFDPHMEKRHIFIFEVINLWFIVGDATICGPNQEYQECGTACPETCAGKPNLCTLQCVSGCFCKKDFVRNGTKCIPRDHCPGKFFNLLYTRN